MEVLDDPPPRRQRSLPGLFAGDKPRNSAVHKPIAGIHASSDLPSPFHPRGGNSAILRSLIDSARGVVACKHSALVFQIADDDGAGTIT
jgi:hypothetical protein